MLQTRVDSGLDGVVVADTVMSEVDGEAGRLIVRGHALEELVATRGYEGTAALLWEGYAEGGGDAEAVATGLGAARMRAFADVPKLVASTHAGLISAVLAGLCALKGPLHGGAPGPVLDMLDEIGEAARAEAWFDDAFAKGTTLMGFGHRIYKVRDPRADVLKAAVAKLPATAGRLAYATEVEKGAIAALRDRKSVV